MAIETLYAYIGRDNEEQIQLKQNNILVTTGAITRAVFKFGSYCLDTDIDTDEIYFLNDERTVLCLKLGLVTDIVPMANTVGKLTLFDVNNANGLAWAEINVTAVLWDLCTI